MDTESKFNFKIYLRAVVAIIMFIAWTLVGISGIVLCLAPEGQHSGQAPLLLELTKSDWQETHLWLALIMVIITILHVVIEWKTLVTVVKYMASTHREQIRNLF